LGVNDRALISEGLLTRVAERLRVLGQVVRLRLVEQLVAGESTPQELAETLGLTQQNVSKHLQVLYKAGVVTRRPEGSNVFYALADETSVTVLEQMVGGVTNQLRELSDLASGSEGHGRRSVEGSDGAVPET
jgi:DNA-binding transcriptional ArsR family regulator